MKSLDTLTDAVNHVQDIRVRSEGNWASRWMDELESWRSLLTPVSDFLGVLWSGSYARLVLFPRREDAGLHPYVSRRYDWTRGPTCQHVGLVALGYDTPQGIRWRIPAENPYRGCFSDIQFEWAVARAVAIDPLPHDFSVDLDHATALEVEAVTRLVTLMIRQGWAVPHRQSPVRRRLRDLSLVLKAQVIVTVAGGSSVIAGLNYPGRWALFAIVLGVMGGIGVLVSLAVELAPGDLVNDVAPRLQIWHRVEH